MWRGLIEQEVLAAGTYVLPGLRSYGRATMAKGQAIGRAAQSMYAQLRGMQPVKMPSPCKPLLACSAHNWRAVGATTLLEHA